MEMTKSRFANAFSYGRKIDVLLDEALKQQSWGDIDYNRTYRFGYGVGKDAFRQNTGNASRHLVRSRYGLC
jgi:hypothetical protein